MNLYLPILRAAAAEAARGALDCFGPDQLPPPEMAYGFIRELWLDIDEPAAVYLPDEAPTEWDALYLEEVSHANR
jgi:hypothetical protein